MIGGTDGNQDARYGCQDGQGVVNGGPHEGQHGGEKSGEDDPKEDDPQLTWVLGQRDAQEAHGPVNRQIGVRPRGEYPERGAFKRVIFP